MNQLFYEECKSIEGIERKWRRSKRRCVEEKGGVYIGLNIAGKSLAPKYFAISFKIVSSSSSAC